MRDFLNCYKVNDMALLYILDTDTEILGFTMVPWERKESYIVGRKLEDGAIDSVKMHRGC